MTDVPEETALRHAAIIPFVLLGGATTFLVVVFILTFSGEPAEREGRDPLLFILLTLGLWTVLQVASKIIQKVREPLLLKENPAAQYLQTVIMKMALLEGPTLFGTIALLICLPGNQNPLDLRLLLLLIPYLWMLSSVLMQRPASEEFQVLVQRASENASMLRNEPPSVF